MNRYRIDLSYVGTDYCGWQSQADGSGVQDVVEAGLKQVLGESLRVTGASRTDSGVHARAQVATFQSAQSIDTFRLQASLQGVLPQTIGIEKISSVANDFSPVGSAVAKTYVYRLWLASRRDPFYEAFVWRVPKSTDLDLLRRALASFVGEHDFSSFCAADSTAKTRQRRVRSISVDDSRLPLVRISISGDGFLKQMVRIIVGTCVDTANAKIDLTAIPDILAAKDRRRAGPTAPAKGLCLEHITYDEAAT